MGKNVEILKPAPRDVWQLNPIKPGEPTSRQAFQLGTELRFYQDYSWTLNPFFTVGEAVKHLDEEISKLGLVGEAWQIHEVMTNIYLLFCAVLNSIDDYMHGPTLRLPKKVAKLPLARLAQKSLVAVELPIQSLRSSRINQARQWKEQWRSGFDAFLQAFVANALPQSEDLSALMDQLRLLPRRSLPADLRAEITRIPSAYRKQDLTPFDTLALGQKFVSRFPDRRHPVLVIGLRTAGSYFAPLLRAFLQSQGYQVVDMLTVRPNRGLNKPEHTELSRCARSQYRAVIIDDPPSSGATIALGVECARKAGFQPDNIIVMFPVRPVGRNWSTQAEATGYVDGCVICLEPEEWYLQRCLAPKAVESRLREYFLQRNYSSATVFTNPIVEGFNADLLDAAPGNERYRLKQVYAVRLEGPAGRVETRYVLAKSVGCGFYAYPAFLAGQRLAEFVPDLLGLRDGILYTEWLPQTEGTSVDALGRSHIVERAAKYVAARVMSLSLESDPTPTLGLDSYSPAGGFHIFAKSLCGAYGNKVTSKLMGHSVRERLCLRTSPFPTLVDGKMAPSEWIVGRSGMLKTDYEHHGFGKHELNVSDAAYDLADTILQFGLSATEERDLLRHYEDATGDRSVKNRLFFYKLLAGFWSLAWSLEALNKQPCHRADDFNKQYIRAWDFLTKECARFCGDQCHRPHSPKWHSTAIVLDVDGVLDRRMFGFPTTTASGIRALRCLHAHGYALAINTARSAREVKEYSSAYGLVGGVAEYGSYIYDAVANHEKILVSGTALEQLEELRQALCEIPGIFVNDGYEYSIRANSYERNGTVPLPTNMVPNLVARLKLDLLSVHQTSIDTTIIANDVDKGRGLAALLDLVGRPDIAAVAIGDSEPDLAMFRVADRCFAPGGIGRPDLVKAVGGQIARAPSQRGLLEIAHLVTHPDRSRCQNCPPLEIERSDQDALFLDLLEIADKEPLPLLLRALLRPASFRVFAKN
jgi:hydroxymethylpyrimidine pyrophosphatase-like HAD family hydrolase